MEQTKKLQGKILVTGAAGLIGSAIIWQLNRMGYGKEIIACDWLPEESDQWKNLQVHTFGDYIDYQALRAIIHEDYSPRLEGLGTVFHMGATSSTATKDHHHLYTYNYEATRGLVGRFAENPKVRLVYASSAATYGGEEPHFSDDHELLHGLRQDNIYGWYKHLVDMHALQRGWLDRRVTALKFFNVYGQNEHHKDQKSIVYRAACEIRDRGRKAKVGLFRPENLARDFTYVKDAAAAAIHLAEGPHYGIFNVGSGVATTWERMVDMVAAAMLKEPPPRKLKKWMPIPQWARNNGYQMRTQAENKKLLDTGFKREFPGMDGVEDCVVDIMKGKRLGE